MADGIQRTYQNMKCACPAIRLLSDRKQSSTWQNGNMTRMKWPWPMTQWLHFWTWSTQWKPNMKGEGSVVRLLCDIKRSVDAGDNDAVHQSTTIALPDRQIKKKEIHDFLSVQKTKQIHDFLPVQISATIPSSLSCPSMHPHHPSLPFSSFWLMAPTVHNHQ